MDIPSLLWKRGRPAGSAPRGYLPLHQWPSGSFTGQYQPVPFVLGFRAPCVGHCGVASAVGGLPWVCNHALACSTCTFTLAKSVPRKVTRTSCPLSLALSVMLTGASGSGELVSAGEVCTGGGVGWLGTSAWPLVPASSFALASAEARLYRPAAMRCLHHPLGALAKSLHSQAPFTTKYAVVPLDWLATLALPSARS